MEENNILDPISEESEKGTLPGEPEPDTAPEEPVSDPVSEAPDDLPTEESGGDPPPPSKKKGGKKLLFAVIAVAAAVAIAVGAAASVFSGSPLSQVAKAAKKTVSEFENTRIVQMREKVEKEGGSLEAALDLAPVTETLLGYGINGKVNLKTYAADRFMALTAGLQIGGVPLADAAVTLDPKNLTVTCPLLFGDTAYGVALNRLEKNFDKSPLGPDGEYSLGITAAEAEEYMSTVTASRKEMSREAEKVFTELYAAAHQSLQDNSTVKKEKSSVTLGGVSHNTTLVTLSMTPAQMVDFLSAMTDYVRSDQALWDLLYDSVGAVGASTVDELRQELDRLPAELEELRAEAATAEGELSVFFHISKSNGCLVGMGLTLTGPEAFSTEVFFGPSPREFRELTFLFRDNYGVHTASYRVETANDSVYEAVVMATEDGAAVVTGGVNWDKETDALDIFLMIDGEPASLTGSFSWSDEAVVFVAEEISYEGDALPLGLGLTLIPGDDMPSVPKYTDVLTMTAEEIGDIVNDLSAVLMSLLGLAG